MKSLLKILLGGTLVFMLVAVAQEWQLFASAWFGADNAEIELAEEEREAAENSVSLTLSLLRHLYASGGDPRFAERIPAAPGIVEEMLVDIDYLARNHRRQEPELLKLEFESIRSLGKDQVEVWTKEFWRMRFSWVDGSGQSDESQHQLIRGRYLVVRDGKGWHVEGWELRFEPESTEAAVAS